MSMHLFMKVLSLCTGAFLVVLLYQNCGGSVHQEGVSTLASEDFFDYKYSASSKFYFTQRLLKPAGAPANLAQFKYFAAVRYLESPIADVTYKVSIMTPMGATLCPLREGTLSPGVTTIEFDCVSAVIADQAVVHLRVNVGADQDSLLNVYR